MKNKIIITTILLLILSTIVFCDIVQELNSAESFIPTKSSIKIEAMEIKGVGDKYGDKIATFTYGEMEEYNNTFQENFKQTKNKIITLISIIFLMFVSITGFWQFYFIKKEILINRCISNENHKDTQLICLEGEKNRV